MDDAPDVCAWGCHGSKPWADVDAGQILVFRAVPIPWPYLRSCLAFICGVDILEARGAPPATHLWRVAGVLAAPLTASSRRRPLQGTS